MPITMQVKGNIVVDIAKLQPQEVWEHFQTLCEIPRPSKHEQQLRDYLKGWAELRGLTVVDAAGNLIVRKPATPGMENRVGVVLQGHLDMVCQANAGTEHDFSKTRSARYCRMAGWWPKTPPWVPITALALPWGWPCWPVTILHGPVEVLMTLDEEAGMGGALGWSRLAARQHDDQYRYRRVGRVLYGLRRRCRCQCHARVCQSSPAGYQAVQLHIAG
jgi:dipeptidase D